MSRRLAVKGAGDISCPATTCSRGPSPNANRRFVAHQPLSKGLQGMSMDSHPIEAFEFYDARLA